MKHDREIRAAFEEAFKPGEAEVDQEAVDEACKAVLEKATEQFGQEGIYVTGILNPDMGGVSFRYKRLGIRQRVEHFMECNVPKPVRPQDEENGGEPVDDTKDDDNNDPGSDDERLSRLIELAGMLEEDDFTKAGAPEVSALNDLLDEGETEFTAAERDNLWAKVPQE